MVFRPLRLAVLVAGAAVIPAGAHAQGLVLDEVRAGVFAHDAYQGFLPTSPDLWDVARIENVKFSALFASPEIDAFAWIGSPRPEVGVTLNLSGRENLVHANLNWQWRLFESPFWVELGFGAALTDAALDGAERPARNMGCALNFYDAIGIGMDVSETVTASLRYEHISNLDLCAPNDGLSNLGFSIGVKF